MIKAVIFDMDGVMVDSVKIHSAAIIEVLKSYIKLSFDDLKKFAGYSSNDIFAELIKKYNIPKSVGMLKSEKDKIFSKNIYKVKLYKGVRSLLNKLQKSGLILSVATSGDTDRTNRFLINTKIKQYFSVVVGYDMVKNAKPHPDLFLEAAKRLGVSNIEVVVIEDAPSGIEAAKTAGMKCIAITNTTSKNKLSKADKIVSDFSDLEELILSL
jgi:HAD superfamily hydrolase (TIGR01509 family)